MSKLDEIAFKNLMEARRLVVLIWRWWVRWKSWGDSDGCII